ncbi:LEM domain-containing protein 1 isoform X2 [Oryzias melastigma]|uniref:LEM domain-containing protein 1 isoform X2 n=1 Tax=Oryzias melastigma TaxID=30732 RepID=UPI000CF7BA99|nr:LEM domain-containing protein 1 isoform X2 [Oryzias melastigma]
MPFVEDPAHLSKARLKSDLVAHNVALPPAASKKEVYVELHLRNIEQKNAAEFSSDDEEQTQEEAVSPSENPCFENGRNEDPEVTQVPDPSKLTDECLKAALLKHGVKAGPIVASTRALYEKKLRKLLLHSNGDGELNGAEKAELYSDSEEEQEEEEEPDEESVSEEEQQKPKETKKIQSENNKLFYFLQAELKFHRGDFSYQQCFLLSSRLRAVPSRNGKPCSKRHSKNVLKSSERSQSSCSQILAGISKPSATGQHSGLRSAVPPASKTMVSNDCSSVSSKTFSITQMVQEMESRSAVSDCTVEELNSSSVGGHCSRSYRFDMNDLDKSRSTDQSLYYTPKDVHPSCGMKLPQEKVKNILKEALPETKTTTTRIYATPRRPIKGAAQRPIQYSLPHTLVSPVTLERREVERRLVSIHIQILFFVFVACIIFFIYVNVQDSTVLALLDSLSHCFDKEGGTLLLPETEDTQALYEQD